jgi:hypothetical protein
MTVINDDLAALQDAFGPPQPRPEPAAPEFRQASLFDLMSGRERREVGMDLAEGAEGTAWSVYADGVLRTLAEELPELHTDDLNRCLELHPRHPNAMGGVWMRAIKAGLIRKSGRTRPSRQRGKNAHDYPIYVSLVYRGAAA